MTIHGAIPRGGYKQQPKQIPRSLGFARYALRADGVDDYIVVPHNTSLNLTNKFTIQLLFKPMSLTQFQKYLLNKDNRYALLYEYVDNMVEFFSLGHTGDAPRLGTQIPITDIKWCDITYAYDGPTSVWEGYKNAVQVFSYTRSFVLATNTKDLLIATAEPTIANVNAMVANLRIYNRKLLPQEIQWNTLNYHNPIRSGLVLWLPMEEGAGETTYDKSGNGNNGTLLPAGGLGPTWQRLRQWEIQAQIE